MFMPKNINCVTIIISLEGSEKIQTEKNYNKTVCRIFLSPTMNVNEHCNGFSILIGCFDSRFSLVYVSGLKYILAR